MPEPEDRLLHLRAVVAEVGAFARDKFENLATITIETKAPADYVSDVDRDAELLARRLIGAAYPGEAVVGEEFAGVAAESHWLIDPVDGTANFLSGIPLWAVSLAYIEKGCPVLGAVGLPALGAIVYAAQDGPLRAEGMSATVAGPQAIAFGIGRNRIWPEAERHRLERELESEGLHIVSLGSCAVSLTMVALGRLRGYVEYGTNLWDCAAGDVLCRAARIPCKISPMGNKVAIEAGYRR